jgi:Helix-turn-helix domain
MKRKQYLQNASDITNFALDGTLKENSLKVTSNHGYTVAPQKIIRCFRLSELEKVILLELFTYLGRNGYAFPSHNFLALKLGKKSTSSVKNALKNLRTKGMIYWYHGGGDFGTNHYYIPDLSKSPYIILSEVTHYYIDMVLKQYRNQLSYDKLYGSVLDFVERPKSVINTYKDYYGMVIEHLEEYPHEEDTIAFYSFYLNLLNDHIYQKTKFKVEIDWEKMITELFTHNYPEVIANCEFPSVLERKFKDIWDRESKLRYFHL